jgi:hypothetical protein
MESFFLINILFDFIIGFIFELVFKASDFELNFSFFQVEGLGYFNLLAKNSELIKPLNVFIFDDDDAIC